MRLRSSSFASPSRSSVTTLKNSMHRKSSAANPLPRIATSCLLEETVQACPDGTASFMHHGALLVGAEVQRSPYLTRRPSLDIAQDDDLS